MIATVLIAFHTTANVKVVRNMHRKHTFYTKDRLPSKVLKHVNKPTIDLNQAVHDQTKVVENCKESFRKVRKKLIMYVDQIIDSHSVDKLALVDTVIMDNVLKSIKNDESEMRSQLVGQQASVDMFKTAVENDEVEDFYLETERVKRNSLTRSLTDIVKDREIVFAALENMQVLSPDAVGIDGILINIVAEYQEVESHLRSEQEKLKKFTEWRGNPGLMLRQAEL